MYESPINIVEYYRAAQGQMEESLFKTVKECGVVVDKEELIKALRYDREQYERGYADGLGKRGLSVQKVANIAAPSMFECSGCRWDVLDTYPCKSEFNFCPNCGKPVLDRGNYPLYSTFWDSIPQEKREEIGEDNLIAMYVALLDPDAEDRS